MMLFLPSHSRISNFFQVMFDIFDTVKWFVYIFLSIRFVDRAWAPNKSYNFPRFQLCPATMQHTMMVPDLWAFDFVKNGK